MIGSIQVQVQAHNPNMPLCPCFTFKGSPSSLRIMGVPKSIGAWRITDVYATFHYPDDSEKTKLSVREGNVYVATVDGCQTTGKVENGMTISANGIDEDGNAVTGYVLGRGDIYVMEGDSVVPDPTTVKNYVKLCDSLPDSPSKGDAFFQNGVLVIYDGTEWVPVFDSTSIHGDYIETLDGMKRISANRDFTDKTNEHGPWTIHSVIGTTDLVLEYDSTTRQWVGEIPETYRYLLFWNEDSEQWKWSRGEWYEDHWEYFGAGVSLYPKDATEIIVDMHTTTRQPPVSNGVLALVSDIPTKTSDLTNDSGFITASEVPTPSYIEDANGNKIDADLSFTNPNWNGWRIEGSGELLKGTKDLANNSYMYPNPQEGDEYYQISFDSQTSIWSLYMFYWSGSWYTERSATASGTIDDTTIEFTGWKTLVQETTNKTIATTDEIPTKVSQLQNDNNYVNEATLAWNYYNKTEIDGMIGDINSVLDAINGEVI